MSAVYVVRTAVLPDGDADFNAWQDDEHLGALLALPGYLGAQRFVDAADPTRYLNVWRLTSPEVFGGPLHEQASHTPWFWRLRPYCTVHVDFGRESPGGDLPEPDLPEADLGEAPWRAGVTGLVVDREQPGSSRLDDGYRQRLAACSEVAQVVRLDPLPADPAADRRSLPAAPVLLSYLTAAATLPAPPEGVQRRRYRARNGYLAAPADPAGRA
ncbi:MAG TPA: hypothetical protein VFR07_14090 [Mycobacteriales bacterium]|nr:hypothetical protein [Mycobacteriales bacterium]